MKRTILITLIMMISTAIFADKYAGEIFQLGAGVKNMAMGKTGLTDENSPAIAYWNPSLLTKTNHQLVELMHSEEYDGLLKYDSFSAIWGKENKFSLVITRIGINDIPLTKLENQDEEIGENNKPYAYKRVNNSDFIAYFGINRVLKDKYFIGLTPKVVYRSLAEENGYGFGADLSTHFDFNDKTRFAARVRDFFSTQIFWENGTHEIVNPGLDLELSRKFILPIKERPLRLAFGVESYFEGREEASTFYIGESSYDFHAGIDLELSKFAHIYSGYDIENITAGLSLHLSQFQIYYAFKNDTELDNSHKVSLAYIF